MSNSGTDYTNTSLQSEADKAKQDSSLLEILNSDPVAKSRFLSASAMTLYQTQDYLRDSPKGDYIIRRSSQTNDYVLAMQTGNKGVTTVQQAKFKLVNGKVEFEKGNLGDASQRALSSLGTFSFTGFVEKITGVKANIMQSSNNLYEDLSQRNPLLDASKALEDLLSNKNSWNNYFGEKDPGKRSEFLRNHKEDINALFDAFKNLSKDKQGLLTKHYAAQMDSLASAHYILQAKQIEKSNPNFNFNSRKK